LRDEDIINGILVYSKSLKALFVSGYPADFIEQKCLLPEGAVLLQKPVSPMDLLATMRRLLDSP
jgi:hypothetical protein